MKDGKYIALVTGATGGLGTHICKRLADDDYIVCANYRSQAKAEAWSEQMKSEGYAFHLYKADVANYDEVEAMVQLMCWSIMRV
jgi:acetoacetyl-CoA reductase